jgi:hypothetical protein
MAVKHFLFFAVGLTYIVSDCQTQRQERRTTPKPAIDECALFKADDAEALSSGQSTYLELGELDVSDQFSLSMEVFPSTINHNGILFSLGSKPNFEYYEWKTDAVNTQYIVVEFLFSALALTLKSLGTQHLHQIEVYKTYPVPYSIDDARWHTVKVFRDRGTWTIRIDELTQSEVVANKTDVQLFEKPAFLGGRPEYTDHQFSGIIRRLRINNRPVQMSGRQTHGKVEVWHCTADEVSRFLTFLKQQQRYARN